MNGKARNNTYANIYTYNKPYDNVGMRFTNGKGDKPKAQQYDSQYINPHVLSGGEASGTVWTNPNVYDVKAEDPGLSWIL